jgi:DNA sulfur modification protein DndD
MRLEFITLTNFRQFFGRQEAEFSMSRESNVTVFHGDNGAGKTSLFTAINWCLYGVADANIGQLASKEAVAKVNEGGSVETRVELCFLSGGSRYCASRTLTSRKVGTAGVPQPGGLFTLTQFKASGDNEVIRNPTQRMNFLLPDNVRTYFFFDGEKMDDLTRANSSEVKEAIRNIMRLPAIERAEGHLKEVASDYRSEIKRQGSPELDKLISQEEKARTEKENAQNRQVELKEEIRLAQQQIADIDTQLRGTETAKPLQKRRDSIQTELQRLETQQASDLSEIQRVVNRSYIKFLSEPAVKALDILDQKREKGEIPSGIREQFIKDLLHEFQCICGRPFAEGDDAYNHLKSLLKTATSNKLASEVIDLAGNLRAISAKATDQSVYLGKLTQRSADAKASMELFHRELDEIKEQLRNISEDNIAGLERKRSEFQRNWQRYVHEDASLAARIVTLDQWISQVTRLKAVEEAKQKKLGALSATERLAQKAADAMTELKSRFFEETRKEVEASTRTVFNKLAWKQDHFQGINIDSDFRLEVIDRWGTPTRKSLSAGERQILSLSFICAMAGVSGEEAPLVMDTPFGRLSSNHLATVAQNLPQLTPQLVLFVTDREWDESARQGLTPRLGRQYKLNFDRHTSCTTIEEME